jgi:hypothetical protein
MARKCKVEVGSEDLNESALVQKIPSVKSNMHQHTNINQCERLSIQGLVGRLQQGVVYARADVTFDKE